MALIWALALNVPIFLYITTTDWYAQLSDGIHWKHYEVATMSAAKDGLSNLGPSHANAPPLPLPLPTALSVSTFPATPTPLVKPVATATSSTQAKVAPTTPEVNRRTAYRAPAQAHAKQQDAVTYFTAPLEIEGASFIAPEAAAELPKGTPGNSVAGKSGKSTGTSSLSPLGTPQ